MNKIFLLVCLTTVLFSCSNDKNEAIKTCKVVSVKTLILTYDDIVLSNTVFDPNFTGKINFEYDNQNRISKVKGSFVSIPTSNNLTNWRMSNEAEDLITYENDIIKVQYSHNFTSPYTKEFVIDDDRLINRKTTNFYPFKSEPILYTYEYNGNEIMEMLNGRVYRKFLLSAGNLIKVEQIKYSFPDNEVIGKREYIFSGYDTSENLLKGKFFISGALFTAFSKNNYSNIKVCDYGFSDNVFKLLNTTSYTYEPSYDLDNISLIFERECN
ncbi:hypothetical protein [Flavobacterium pectinovorum]|uniref:hypothetical protein n=1 Tax=Flavobacterium pectinovorum TaxID=29533 RepID=UPI001FAB440D|nr:hypothetical protein [Flavobacterium pectinovorum]MCI9846445.1 hypothetical protein [Flavobacterium pectinovorum]